MAMKKKNKTEPLDVIEEIEEFDDQDLALLVQEPMALHREREVLPRPHEVRSGRDDVLLGHFGLQADTGLSRRPRASSPRAAYPADAAGTHLSRPRRAA